MVSEAGVRYFFAVAACLLAILSTILVASWAQNKNTTNNYAYLEKPVWSSNTLAWHPVLTVAGYMMGQVFASSAWILIPHKPHAKAVHVLMQIGALITMCYGLAAVVKYKNDRYENALTSAHSWIGVAAVSFFCVNFCLGALMGTLTKFSPDSKLRSAFDLRRIHRATGFTSMGLCALACVSGVMNQLTYGYCGNEDKNDYNDLPDACRIANGMGIAIMCSVLCAVCASSMREDPSLHPGGEQHTQVAEKEVEMQ